MADRVDPPYLFVSYASADRDQVLPVVDRLTAAGVQAWVDREGIHGGANYAQVINDAIKNSAALLLFASPASLASRNVRQEIALGWRYEKPYLPLLLDPVTIPDELAYWLEGSQWIELLDRPRQVWLAELSEALRHYGITVQLPSEAPPVPAPLERPLLVGREREQQVLREQLDRMLAGRGGVVLVGGEAGIGKTTLAEDLSVQAEEVGCLVLWGHAYDLSVTPPYGPWLEIFQRYRLAAGDLPPLPAFIGDAAELAKVGSQERLFASVAAFFTEVAARRPLVLVLDDLHWADQASLDFFRLLARQLADQRILLLATYRSDELTRRHPLYTLLPLLVREAGAVRLPVQPLDLMGHRALIRSRYQLADGDQARLEQYLTEHAEGNPLYAGELLRTLEDERVLTEGEGGWQLGDLEYARVPPLLMQVIEGRLGRLSEETRGLLQLAAVIGQEVPLALWQQVGGASNEALLLAIEQGQAAQLIEEVAGGERYRFQHALLREVLYEEVIAPRRRTWHRQVAEILETTRSPDPDIVAHHYQQAGDSRAISWLINAAERAERAYVWSTAAERFDTALAKLTEEQVPAGERAVLMWRIARALRFVKARRALALVDEARHLANEAGERALSAHCLFLAGWCRCALGDVRAGLSMLEEALEALRALSPTEEMPQTAHSDVSDESFETMVVLYLACAGYLKEAMSRGERILAKLSASVPRPGQIPIDLGVTANGDRWHGLAIAEAMLGQPVTARHAAQQARDDYYAAGHHALIAWTRGWELDLVQLPYFTEELERRTELAADAEAARQRAEHVHGDIPPQLYSLSLLILAGAWAEARTVAKLVEQSTTWPVRIYGGPGLAILARRQDETAAAQRMVREVLPDGPSTEPGNTFLSPALSLQRVAVELALDDHDLPTARAWLEAHDRWLDWSGAVLGKAEGALLWGQYHHASGDQALARQHAEQALAHASDPRQPLALIAVRRFLGQLETEARQFDAAEEHVQQSLSLAEACAAPFERALTLLELAKLRLVQGKTEEARELLGEVRSICEPLGAKPTLERVAALERQLGG